MRVDEAGDHQHCRARRSRAHPAAVARGLQQFRLRPRQLSGALDRDDAVALDDDIAQRRAMDIARPVIDTAAADQDCLVDMIRIPASVGRRTDSGTA